MTKVEAERIVKAFDRATLNKTAEQVEQVVAAKGLFAAITSYIGKRFQNEEECDKYVGDFLLAWAGGKHEPMAQQQASAKRQATGETVGVASGQQMDAKMERREPDAIVFQTIGDDGKEQRVVFRVEGHTRLAIQVIPGELARKEIGALGQIAT